MAVVRRRTAAKRLHYSSLGRRMVTFRIGKIQRTFTLHEDLICRSSVAFRRHLQGNRKEIEGECSICHETLKANKGEIAYCRAGCGQNFHEHCMDQWKATGRGTSKCSVCRQVWNPQPNDAVEFVEVIADGEPIDEDAIHVYCDWLYTGSIHIDESVRRNSEDFGLRILKAYTLSSWLEDADFTDALVANHIAENRFAKRFWLSAVNYIFVELEGDDAVDQSDDEWGQSDDEEEADVDDDPMYAIDKFVIDNFIEGMNSRFFQRHGSTLPGLFVWRLGQRLLARTQRPKKKDVLEEHTRGNYEIDERELSA